MLGSMSLSPPLRRELQRAYASDFGNVLGDAEAEALGIGLLETLGPFFVAAACVHRSAFPILDDSTNKREPERPPQTI